MAAAQHSVRFIVTGFGPFANVPDNPTQILVQKLIDYLEQQSPSTEAQRLPLASMTETIILETSAEAARLEIDRLQKRLEEESCIKGNDETIVVVLHLGVDHSGTCFHLETCAYNEATFRVPDERGYQPEGVSILGDDTTVGAPLHTLLQVAQLVDEMNASIAGGGRENCCNAVAEISTNPGRFVCNYTYCYSLYKFNCGRTDSTDGPAAERNGKNGRYKCLFLHVPPFTVVPEEQQLWFVSRLMETLYTHLTAEK